MAETTDIAANLDRVGSRIERAARRAGRDPATVRLVAVTKGVPAALVRAAVEAGVTDLGENRVQEGAARRAELVPDFPGVKWHFIGHLQTNKAARAVASFSVIHSVDSLRVAEALSRSVARTAAGIPETPLDVLVQVNVAGEKTKFGVSPDETQGLVQAVACLPGLRLRGLMTIAPLVDDPEKARPVFRRLASLARDIDPAGAMAELSMGMSQDFEVAVEEGATLVRIGTAVFGPRRG